MRALNGSSFFRRIQLVLLILSTQVCWAQVSDAQIENVSGVIDLSEAPDGSVTWGLKRKQGLFKVAGDQLGQFRSGSNSYRGYFPGEPTTFERIFPDLNDPQKAVLVARYRADDLEHRIIYPLQDGKFEFGLITQKFSGASYHQTKKGELFIYSRSGVIVRYFDGRLDHYQLPLQSDLQNKTGKFREIKCVESADGTMAFYSIVDPELNQKALRHLVIYRNGWKAFDLKDYRTGPGYFIDESNFALVGPATIISVRLTDGAITESATPKWNIPGLPQSLSPIDVLVDPQGQPMFLARHFYRNERRYAVNAFSNGEFHTAARLKRDGDQWKWVDEGLKIDYELYRKRFSVTDSKNNWWIVGSGALWRRAPDGKWDEFGFRFGINPPESTTHVKLDRFDRLWIMNNKDPYSRAQVIDLQNLKANQTVLSSSWGQAFLSKKFDSSKRFMAFVDRKNAAHFWTATGTFNIQLPTEEFDQDDDRLIPASTGELFYYCQSELRLYWHHDGNWRHYPIRQNDTQGKTAWQLVLQDREAQGLPAGNFSADQHQFILSGNTLESPAELNFEDCPVVEEVSRRRSGHVLTRTKIAVGSPDGRWHTHLLSNPAERLWLTTGQVTADNHGRIFTIHDVYYKPKTRMVWYEPIAGEIVVSQPELGIVEQPNQEIEISWQIQAEKGQAVRDSNEETLYRWRINSDPWSRWLPQTTKPVLYATPDQGIQQLEIEISRSGWFFKNPSATYSFETKYDLSELVKQSIELLKSDSFEERKNAARELANFGIGVIPILQEVEKTGSPDARILAQNIIQEIKKSPRNDQHRRE